MTHLNTKNPMRNAAKAANTAWRREAPLHRPVGRGAGGPEELVTLGAFFWFVFFGGDENEQPFRGGKLLKRSNLCW
jgi:hypothetical protein